MLLTTKLYIMKKLLSVIVLLFIMVVVSFASCSKNDNYIDNPLVGIWKTEKADDNYVGDIVTWTFNKNLSGEAYVYNNTDTHTENNSFTWGVDDGVLKMVFTAITITRSYSISDNKLRFHFDRQEDEVFTRQ
jgi:hypothetical protein